MITIRIDETYIQANNIAAVRRNQSPCVTGRGLAEGIEVTLVGGLRIEFWGAKLWPGFQAFMDGPRDASVTLESGPRYAQAEEHPPSYAGDASYPGG
jgi:hypothetical protein